MNNLLKNYLNSKYDLLRFFTHYERAVASRRYKESMADFKMRQSTPVMFLDVKILNETAKVYTPEVFEMFQEEYKKHLRYSISKCGGFGTIAEYCVYNDKDERRTVRFNSLDGTMTCSCKKFEFVGILCGHALKVLDFYNIKEVDPRYIMKRWRRDAKEGFGRDHTRVPTKGEHNIVLGKRYKYLCSKLHRIAAMAEEHDELFKFADKYTDKFHDEMMERMKGMKEPPLRSSKSVDESIEIEHAHHKPTESEETRRAHSRRNENVDTKSACHKPTESIDIETTHPEPIEKEVTFVNSQSSQTVSGIKVKPRVRGNRRVYQNPLDKVRKKKSRTESVQPQANQERRETAQAPNIMHPTSFQPSNYSIPSPELSHLNQGTHIAVMSPSEVPIGSHVGPGHHMVIGYTPASSGSINAPLVQFRYQAPHSGMFQQNLFNIRPQSESFWNT
ncbi:protein FAR-RED ELONGATED HYPOCOTYL 3-like [Magnolia sinica]|uniref:protein FAR-RED ELONGATED HYPOCOTYL 3-like n=1 Tax=Magnolia sinica TaxID=86752 RepID=UPI00265976E2|nr:protein FAR-RED ELONGATED HYPOCOTYL 3-like [Magnolia sinica]